MGSSGYRRASAHLITCPERVFLNDAQLNLIFFVIGISVLTFGLFSRPLQRVGVPGPLLLVLGGVALGPSGTGWLKVDAWGDPYALIHEAATLSLAIGLMGVALRLPRSFMARSWRSVVAMTATSTLFMWLASAGILGLVLGRPVWEALLLGAIVTPTDPVVASSLVTGPLAERHLPERLRHTLSSESGLNDGLALPFVLLPILWLSRGGGWGVAGTWLLEVMVWEVGVGALGGVGLGYGCGRLLQFARDKGFMERPSILDFATALALVTLSLMRLLESDGLLAVFMAGLAFDRVVSPDQREREEQVVEGIDHFFTLPIFVLLGTMIPWQAWATMGWHAPALLAALMLARRLPLFLLFARRLTLLPTWRDGLWLGWFGPIGVAALFYATMAMDRSTVDHIWPVVSLITCASIALHGLSAAPLTRLYGRHSTPPPPSES